MTTNKKFTLIELLIVLAIIGAVATLALDQSSEVVDQTRYDLTEQNGAEIQNAIIGDIENGGRFLRDMGRLPIVISTDQGRGLEELWNADSAVSWSEVSLLNMNNASSTIKWSDPERTWGTLPNDIFLSAGWRGPYLNMGARTELYDGWGNPWALDIADYTDVAENSGAGDGVKDGIDWRDNDGNTTPSAPTVGNFVFALKSFGRDQNVDTGTPSWQNLDHTFEFPKNRVFCSVTFSIKIRHETDVLNAISLINYLPVPAGGHDESVNVIDSSNDIYRSRKSNNSATLPSKVTNGDWLYIGNSADHPEYLQSMRTAVFVPDFTANNGRVMRVLCEWDGDDDINDNTLFSFDDNATMVDDELEAVLDDNWSTIKIDGLMPGIRKFYIYGFNGDYRRGSFVQTIDLKPGSNFREVILTEPLD